MIEPHGSEESPSLGIRYRTLIPASDWWFAYALWGHEPDRPPTVEWQPVVAWAILAPEYPYDDDRVVPLIVDEELSTPALCPAVDWRWECTSNQSRAEDDPPAAGDRRQPGVGAHEADLDVGADRGRAREPRP
jgi:hypothetical protein